jgi:UDP-3-O-[3-hydroxymyristoyl] glucosamine N-acyltransferase
MTIGHGQHCAILDDVNIGEGTRIGNFVFIREKPTINKCCIVGSYLNIEAASAILFHCKVARISRAA